MVRILSFLIFTLTPPLALALPQASQVPGGVAVIQLGESASAPRARYQGDRVLVMRDNGQWYAVVGIPRIAKPVEHCCPVSR